MFSTHSVPQRKHFLALESSRALSNEMSFCSACGMQCGEPFLSRRIVVMHTCKSTCVIPLFAIP